jgi:hypothetical protein
MQIKINITPMALKIGVLGLPIECCRDWNAMKSYNGTFNYAHRSTNVTFTAKHIDYKTGKASAWQFTINDSVQFAELKMDGVYTYTEGVLSDENLECDIMLQNEIVTLTVIKVNKKAATNATNKIKELLNQGIRPISQKSSKAPEWNAPSSWIPMSEIDKYKDVSDCLYLWYGRRHGYNTVYLYVGIVGDTKKGGKTKRSLAQRLREENKKIKENSGLEICKFRFCSLNNAHGFSIPELLKTVEMSEITVMTSLFKCENSRDNIDALFKNYDVVLLNKRTSFKYID